MIYVKAFLLFLIISQDFKPKQKKGKNNKDASVWDGEDTPPCLLHLYLEESFFLLLLLLFFLFNKGQVLSQSCNRKKKKMDVPLGKISARKANN